MELQDITWLQKLASRNPSVSDRLKRARHIAVHGEASQDTMDGFCQALHLDDPDPTSHLSGPQDPITLAEWFHNKQRWFRGN